MIEITLEEAKYALFAFFSLLLIIVSLLNTIRLKNKLIKEQKRLVEEQKRLALLLDSHC